MSDEKKQKSLSDIKMMPELEDEQIDEKDAQAIEKIERDKVRKGRSLLGNMN